MSDATNLDDLFAQIDKVAEDLKQTQASGDKKGGGKGKTNFGKSLDMVFLAAVMGGYEAKPFVDSTGKVVEELYLHTVKTATAKVTVPCKGEGCTICALQKKLDGMKNKAAWKFKPYKVNKILIKIGDSQTDKLKAGNVYVAYVDDSYFKPMIDSIKTNKKYFAESLGDMLQAAKDSAGFVVNASKSGKKSSYNFNFIEKLQIKGVDIKEVFGTESYKLENLGYFRKNYIDPQKLSTAESIINKMILATAEAAAAKKGGDSGKTEPDSESKKPVESTETKSDSGNSDSTPAPVVEETKIEVKQVDTIDRSSLPKDPKNTDENGDPLCFGYFDPNSQVCSTQCQHKRKCLTEAMNNDRI